MRVPGYDQLQAAIVDEMESANNSTFKTHVDRVRGSTLVAAADLIAVEEPLEIQLEYGASASRKVESIAVTMRTPGHDLELAVGFLLTENIIRERADVIEFGFIEDENRDNTKQPSNPFQIVRTSTSRNVIRVQLAPHVEVDAARLKRNFYTTSSCGVCGKASLMALQNAYPPQRQNQFLVNAEILYALPGRLRQAQAIFDRTGGLHGAALFDADGSLISIHEDVGRHNAVDKLIGSQLLLDRVPLSNTLLMLSGRASFELLQKALMAGISMVAAVGAPSSLAVDIARHFDIALVGFLRDDRFNVYHGREHLACLEQNEGYRIQ